MAIQQIAGALAGKALTSPSGPGSAVLQAGLAVYAKMAGQ
jgi:hypothetical protein